MKRMQLKNRRHPFRDGAGSASVEVAMLTAAVAATALVAVSGFGEMVAGAVTDSCREFAVLSGTSPQECHAPPEPVTSGG
jgi:Flp pilus assembly pilin Flp